MRNLIPVALLAALLSSAACTTTDEPSWLTTCEELEPLPASGERQGACKEACAAGHRCDGATQAACETECNACAPDVAWCPLDGWVPE